ncbi:MAG: dipeptidase PepE [Lentimicrobiaceae bacterium]|jgi:dipeptidase E|nr:dipeptidase PepE [Lentimicrobiaceae bacterium]
MKLLLISNSTNRGEAYLDWPKEYISKFMNEHKVKKVLFIPYAGVNIANPKTLEDSYNAYEAKVKPVFEKLGFELTSIHRTKNLFEAVQKAECIAVGGGNTFHLVGMMQQLGIMKAIREKVLNGTPYMGWSAGANVACPTMKTTNDMPIVQPESFDCLNLIPFQINPHYLGVEDDLNAEKHGGETREERINEFLAANREAIVVGLRESCLLERNGDSLLLKGKRTLRIFKHLEVYEQDANTDVSFLLKAQFKRS